MVQDPGNTEKVIILLFVNSVLRTELKEFFGVIFKEDAIEVANINYGTIFPGSDPSEHIRTIEISHNGGSEITGCKFYLSENGVWLTDHVDVKYFNNEL